MAALVAVASLALTAEPQRSEPAPQSVLRPWACWTLSIAEQSVFPPVVNPDICAEVRPTAIRLDRTATVAPLVAPGPPASLSASVSGSTVNLTWSAPAGGDPPTSYVLEAGSSSGSSNLVNADTGSTATSLTATEVAGGTYFVRVRARNASGTSAPSNEVIVVVSGACAGPPNAPTSLAASSTGASVTLTWFSPASGCAPTAYVIEGGSAPGLSNLANFSTGNAATLFSASGVAGGTYYLRVRSSNGAGTSGPSNEVQFVISPCAGPPAPPLDFVAQVNGATVILSWTAAGGSPASYVIEAGSAPGISNLLNTDTGNLATSLTALAGPGTYYVRVRSRNGCGTSTPSTEAVVVVPALASCVVIAPMSQAVGNDAVIGTVSVNAPSSCAWTAVSNAPFLTVTSGSSGSGAGSVGYGVAGNSTGNVRAGTLTIGGQTFTVTQQGCSYTASMPPLMPPAGGPTTVTVTAGSGCSWSAQSDAAFAAIVSGAAGNGSGLITLDVQSNSGSIRGATLLIGQGSQTTTAEVVQSGPAGSLSCVNQMIRCFNISPACSSWTVAFNGGTTEVNLVAPATCAWIAAPTVPWLTTYPTSGQNQTYGLGSGHFGFSAAPNPDPAPRSGGVAGGGFTFPITQGACEYVLSLTNATVPASGGSGFVTVGTTCSASWTAASNASFMAITSGASGTGNGSVGVVVGGNTGSTRTGTLTIAGQTVTVTQSGP